MDTKTYSTGEVAKRIGVSRQTLQAWITVGKVAAPKTIAVGGMSVRMWTAVDIERARKFKGTLKPGPQTRPKKKK
jgi:excisionase family DNA binding protein